VTGAMSPFGQMTSGTLTVNAYMRELLLLPYIKWLSCRFDVMGPPDARWPAVGIDPHTTLAFGIVALDSLKSYHHLIRLYHDAETYYSSTCKPNGETKHAPWLLESAMPVSCMLAYCFESSDGWRDMTAVVLVPVDTEHKLYRRIGLLRTYEKTDSLSNGLCNAGGQPSRQTVHIV
jgi:hypothetical protein